MSRFAKERRVFVFEEPMFTDDPAHLAITPRDGNVFVAVPHLQHGTPPEQVPAHLRTLVDELVESREIGSFLSWYYTPMMLEFSSHLEPVAVVYDCMDQLSAFKGAPPELVKREAELLQIADLVFTGGRSLYEAKRESHSSVHAFPSSIDVPHFATAASFTEDPADMAAIPHPRVGFIGVIDERMDIGLLDQIAGKMPEFQFVMIGPVVKIDDNDLPRRSNIHYLGSKDYKELPRYIGRWDVAMMPFAMNESTRYISPTKTPEYLAAGRPVVSTPVHDVVRPYGEEGLVHIAADADEFVDGIKAAMNEDPDVRRQKVDAFLADMSWDSTFAEMWQLIDSAIAARLGIERTTAKSAGFP